MSQLHERQHVTTERLPQLFRNRTVDYTLMIVGAIVGALGAYTYFASSSWLWAGLSDAWFLGAWIIGGVLLAIGFGMLGASVRDRSGRWTVSAVASFVVGALALAGAVAAAVVLIL